MKKLGVLFRFSSLWEYHKWIFGDPIRPKAYIYGTPKTINFFPFVPNEKVIIYRCPNRVFNTK